MSGKDVSVVVVHVVAGIQQHLLFEINSGGRFVMETHRSQAFVYEILRRVNGYWSIVSGTGQKVGYIQSWTQRFRGGEESKTSLLCCT
jgi:hypothetical protein